MPRRYSKTTKTTSSSRKAKPPASRRSAGKNAPRTQRSSTRSQTRSSSGQRRSSLKRTASTVGTGRFHTLRRVLAYFQNRRQSAVKSQAPSVKVVSPTKQGLSLDRKLDIIGIVLIFVGLPTILSLFSVTNSQSTGGWLSFWGKAFGLGVYLFPIVLVTVGFWLVLRNFERVPQLSLERLIGLILLYGQVLTTLHFAALPANRVASMALASGAKGGGYVGAFFFELLRYNLGWGGTVVALAAWLLIALPLVFEKSLAELFHWVRPLILKLQDAWDDMQSRRAEKAGGVFGLPGFKPLPGSMSGDAQAVTAPGHVSDHSFPPAGEAGQTWVLPALADILESGAEAVIDDEYIRQRARLIEETLASFGAPVNVVEVNRGPTVTQFGVEPDFVETRSGRTRVRVGKVASLADDLALALAARTIRVQAPVPGKGYVGIEVPNEQISLVALRDVLESDAFQRLKSNLRFAIGHDVAGHPAAADLSVMPHLLVAGATGSGKSVCVNALICSLLLYNTPDDLRLIMVDPKRVELTGYNGIPHLLAPVVVEMERVVGALQWVLREMDQRYHKLAQAGTRNITEYNTLMTARGEALLPRLVVFIDELADLMMLAPDETERTITRLAQLARATGIHLVIATQRPSVDVVTGLIKANFPSRIAFAVTSGVDSRVILDQPGAERLLGRGDMLFQAPDAAAPLRLQGAFVSDAEIQRLVDYWRGHRGVAVQPSAAAGVVDALPLGVPLKQIPLWDEMQPEEKSDPMLDEAIDLSRRQGRASISMLQRRLRIGYTRSARLIETMQEKGIIGDEPGPQGFEILDYGPAAPPISE
jgi:S-DNA-T family DNA segregation ATPase FtsK/SpoIIIE